MTSEHCDQCGREGQRGYEQTGDPTGQRGIDFFVTCTNRDACRKRWPQPTKDDE